MKQQLEQRKSSTDGSSIPISASQQRLMDKLTKVNLNDMLEESEKKMLAEISSQHHEQLSEILL